MIWSEFQNPDLPPQLKCREVHRLFWKGNKKTIKFVLFWFTAVTFALQVKASVLQFLYLAWYNAVLRRLAQKKTIFL